MLRDRVMVRVGVSPRKSQLHVGGVAENFGPAGDVQLGLPRSPLVRSTRVRRVVVPVLGTVKEVRAAVGGAGKLSQALACSGMQTGSLRAQLCSDTRVDGARGLRAATTRVVVGAHTHTRARPPPDNGHHHVARQDTRATTMSPPSMSQLLLLSHSCTPPCTRSAPHDLPVSRHDHGLAQRGQRWHFAKAAGTPEAAAAQRGGSMEVPAADLT